VLIVMLMSGVALKSVCHPASCAVIGLVWKDRVRSSAQVRLPLTLDDARLELCALDLVVNRMTAVLVLVVAPAMCAPANALECLVHSVARDYWRHNESAETLVLALGRFTDIKLSRDEVTVAPEVELNAKYEVWTAGFQGFLASRKAFDKPFEARVTLNVPDCSFIAGGSDGSGEIERLPGKTGLVWLLQTPDGDQATSGLCDSIIDTDPANVKPALRCLRGGFCPNPD